MNNRVHTQCTIQPDQIPVYGDTWDHLDLLSVL